MARGISPPVILIPARIQPAIGAPTTAAVCWASGLFLVAAPTLSAGGYLSWRSRHSAPEGCRHRLVRQGGHRTTNHPGSTPPRRRSGRNAGRAATNGHGLCCPHPEPTAAALAMRNARPKSDPTKPNPCAHRYQPPRRQHLRGITQCCGRGAYEAGEGSSPILPRWKRTAAASTPERSLGNCAAGGDTERGLRTGFRRKPAARSERCQEAGRPEQPCRQGFGKRREPPAAPFIAARLSVAPAPHRVSWVTSMPGKVAGMKPSRLNTSTPHSLEPANPDTAQCVSTSRIKALIDQQHALRFKRFYPSKPANQACMPNPQPFDPAAAPSAAKALATEQGSESCHEYSSTSCWGRSSSVRTVLGRSVPSSPSRAEL